MTVAGQTQVAYVALFGKAVGNGCDLSVGITANVSGVPTGISLQTTLPADFWGTTNGWVYVPVPNGGGLTASTTYWITVGAGDTFGNNAGDAANYISLEKSNQVTGAATFTSGVPTAQSYGFMFREFDYAASGDLTFIYEDDGARWTWIGYDSFGGVLNINEYTVSQAAGQMRSARSVTESVSPTIPVEVS